MKQLLWIPLVLGLALAQTPIPTPVQSPAQRSEQRLAQKATQEMAKAQAAKSYLQGLRLGNTPAWLSQGDALLTKAQSDLQAQRYFAAKERADAAKKIYEAALILNGQPLGRTTKKATRPDKSAEQAYRAQQKVGRLEAELAYYRNNNSSVRHLLGAAKGLQTNQPEVARKLAEAGLDIIKADRGF
ncbi:hypothetical protein [Calidithermus roseus]|uniref:DUF4398 domain-containing protein n=1 Tax=Calidithermus roseus TaxID=1644118 RepID=A0A399EGT8_9DEIN|nr:hypothetical protein [Calidithermus roseus]RIH82310.1 hypothetical protein Mrose_03415 [Calidithermus roseus]